jgi:hypothetical protein
MILYQIYDSVLFIRSELLNLDRTSKIRLKSPDNVKLRGSHGWTGIGDRFKIPRPRAKAAAVPYALFVLLFMAVQYLYWIYTISSQACRAVFWVLARETAHWSVARI